MLVPKPMRPISMSCPIHTPSEGPPQNRPPSEIFAFMGTENIFRMIHDFYAEIYNSSIAPLFPEDRHAAADRSAAFFVFWLGGPPLYQEKYGHPRLRQRHLPFPIDATARQVWLDCLAKTLDGSESKYQFPKEHFPAFWSAVESLSAWMVNKK